jgi:hypothetical protein
MILSLISTSGEDQLIESSWLKEKEPKEEMLTQEEQYHHHHHHFSIRRA